MNPLLRITHEASEEMIQLLEETTLGTDGAQYQLLNTRQRIHQIDNPVHLTLVRNDKILANLTFCIRGKNWYLRYFAFDKRFQGKGLRESRSKNSILKAEIIDFFKTKLEAKEVDSFYAYIDPKNTKSSLLAGYFGFKTIGQIRTQSFSRYLPKSILHLKKSNDIGLIESLATNHFGKQNFFFTAQLKKNGFYYLQNEEGEIIAFAQVNHAHWKIKRLPGKSGHLMKKAIPYLPLVNKLIKPDNHKFVAVDTVWMKTPSATLLSDLFETILYIEKRNVLFWWHDVDDSYFNQFKKQITWGLINLLLKRPKVDVVAFPKPNFDTNSQHYVSAIDMI